MTGHVKVIPTVELMHSFSAALAELLPGGAIVGLSGPLGAGKTEFVRGICLAAGIAAADVSSPSYVLEQLYTVQNQNFAFDQVSHWDLFRLSDSHQLAEILDRARPDTVVFVEWPERFPELGQSLSVLIMFAHGAGEERELTLNIYDRALEGVILGVS